MTSNRSASWVPDGDTIAHANLTWLMQAKGLSTYRELHRWSVEDKEAFWSTVIQRLGIVFDNEPDEILVQDDPRHPHWLAGARLNIVRSCFTDVPPDTPAILSGSPGRIRTTSYGELDALVNQVASGLGRIGVVPGDSVAIAMPMTVEAVAAYLGTIWMGGVVVSIADSFASDEIARRLRIADCDLVFTSDFVDRGDKALPMFSKVVEAGARRAIVVGNRVELRPSDLAWDALTLPESASVAAPHVSGPDDTTNVLFSSGTTGVPKAIPWNQLTPIKAAMDAHFHHDVREGDVLAWPTNLGWMMGPWLIYATLLNGATMALYDDVPTSGAFGEFVAETRVTMLGVVPSLVAVWRRSGCMESLDWSRVRRFSSTGEASNHDDMAYLMNLAGNRPIIEYCGGTEIGGGYLSATVLQTSVPATFTTPTLGLDFVLLDETGRESSSGEVFLIPPSVGLSIRLLHGDHNEVYYAGCPTRDGVVLRRHGDHIAQITGSQDGASQDGASQDGASQDGASQDGASQDRDTKYGYARYRALGRIDDTMNLGGIKVSSAEIERVVGDTGGLIESAAIGVPPQEGGPSHLVIFAVAESGFVPDASTWKNEMQEAIRVHLNPLFKVHDVIVTDGLPRTASAKVMRRKLRDDYGAGL